MAIKPAQKHPPLVHLEWLDSYGPPESAWIARDEAKERTVRFIATSVGFVMAENDDYVVVGSHLTSDHAAGILSIPKRAIIKRKTLSLK